jgi:spore coat polysaccharide biosynthesis protein SpsF
MQGNRNFWTRKDRFIKMRVAAIITARVGSTRLHKKVLRDLGGIPLIVHVLNRSASFPEVSTGGGVILAIPEGEKENELARVGESLGVKVVRGDEDDVLSRILLAAETVGADVIYRITGDNPLIDPGVVSGTWQGFQTGDWDYAVMEGTPLGTTAEIVTLDALKKAQEFAATPQLREHPTLALYENNDVFRMHLIPCPANWHHPDWRFTIDSEDDFQLVEKIITELGHDATLDTIVPFLESNPGLLSMNSSVAQDGWERLKEKKDAIGHIQI